MANAKFPLKRDLQAEQDEVDRAFREWQSRFPYQLGNKKQPVSPEIFKGLATSLPIILGYLPVAAAYGISAAALGIPAFAAIGMSVLVFAGSSQFIAVALLGAGAAPFSIILTTFIINSRHFLMSTAMLKHLRKWPLGERFLFSLQMTDESFAIHSSRLPHYPDSKPRIMATNFFPHLAWITGTVFGYFASSLLPAPELLGLDFALPAMFIALITLQMDSLMMLGAAMMSVGLVILLQLTDLNQWSVIIAAVMAALFCGLKETWERKN